jgi:hypothetical protein
MLSNFFRTSTDYKQRTNKKHNIEFDGPASSGGQENYMKCVGFKWLPVEAAMSVFNFCFCVKNIFLSY